MTSASATSRAGAALTRAGARVAHLGFLAIAGSAWLVPGVRTPVVALLGAGVFAAVAAEYWRARALSEPEESDQRVDTAKLMPPAPFQARIDAASCVAAAIFAAAAVAYDVAWIAALGSFASCWRAWRWRAWSRERAAAKPDREAETTCKTI